MELTQQQLSELALLKSLQQLHSAHKAMPLLKLALETTQDNQTFVTQQT
jgi:hypothetical protein